ncbi:hypothetical protein WJX82_005346 [Trebouxia sp. C0006]
MGAGISHCEEQHEEPASGQQVIQSSDTASKKKPTTDMPKDAGKSKSKNDDEKSAPTKQGKDQSTDNSKSEGKDSKADSKPAGESDSKSESTSDSKPESKDSKPESKSKQDEDKGSDDDAGDSEEGEENEEEEPEEPKITKEDVKSTPYDHRFPSFNQARHCFTKYNEFYKCTAEKGDDSSDCKFHQKAYRSICPSEWLEKWNEQQESGTWPGRY